MINLKEIEKAIDELLANETPDSLKSWLKDQCNPAVYLGQGEFIESGLQNQYIEIASSINIKYTSSDIESEYVDSCAYTMAA